MTGGQVAILARANDAESFRLTTLTERGAALLATRAVRPALFMSQLADGSLDAEVVAHVARALALFLLARRGCQRQRH